MIKHFNAFRISFLDLEMFKDLISVFFKSPQTRLNPEDGVAFLYNPPYTRFRSFGFLC